MESGKWPIGLKRVKEISLRKNKIRRLFNISFFYFILKIEIITEKNNIRYFKIKHPLNFVLLLIFLFHGLLKSDICCRDEKIFMYVYVFIFIINIKINT